MTIRITTENRAVSKIRMRIVWQRSGEITGEVSPADCDYNIGLLESKFAARAQEGCHRARNTKRAEPAIRPCPLEPLFHRPARLFPAYPQFYQGCPQPPRFFCACARRGPLGLGSFFLKEISSKSCPQFVRRTRAGSVTWLTLKYTRDEDLGR